jgi:hypothetical protein
MVLYPICHLQGEKVDIMTSPEAYLKHRAADCLCTAPVQKLDFFPFVLFGSLLQSLRVLFARGAAIPA